MKQGPLAPTSQAPLPTSTAADGAVPAAATGAPTGDATVAAARSAAAEQGPDAQLTVQILRRTLNEIAGHGYANLQLERIARAAGCARSAILRRWPTRGALASAALIMLSDLGEIPDTGDLVEDLVEHTWCNATNQRRMRGADLPHPVWSVMSEPEVYEHFRHDFLSRRRDMGLTVIQRAMDRGELSEDVDAQLILDTLAGLTLYRVSLQSERLSREQIRPVLSALVENPPLREDSPARRDLPLGEGLAPVGRAAHAAAGTEPGAQAGPPA